MTVRRGRSLAISRRGLMAPAALLLAVLADCGKKSAAPGAACLDVNALTLAQRTLRISLHYVEASRDPGKSCAGCRLFKPAGNCGTCTLFDGPANPHGRCDSWTAKAA